MPNDETIFEYQNGTKITFHLDKSGHFCGIQTISSDSPKGSVQLKL